MPIGRSLRGRYDLAVAIGLLGLGPNVVLTTAFVALAGVVAHDLGSSAAAVDVVEGLSNAGLAVGAVSGAALAQRHGQRRLFLGYEAVFVVASVLTVVAPDIVVFGVGRVVQGLAAGAMLISSLPPLVTRFGVRRLSFTVVVVNIGLFGASTLGPLVGGLVAEPGQWRILMGAVAALGLVGGVVALLGYVETDPLDPDLPLDRSSLILVTVGTTLLFLGTSALAGTPLTSPLVLVPLVLGAACVAALLVVGQRKERPLMPVALLSTQLPVSGILAAMVGGAVFVSVLQLLQLALTGVAHLSPGAVAARLLMLPVGLLVAAVAFGVLFRTPFVPVLIDVGLLVLALTCVLLLVEPREHSWALVGGVSLLLGFGAGATVSPGLFMAGLGVPSTMLARAFALVQLLRSVATYAVAPVVAYVARSHGDLQDGVHAGLVAMLALSLAGLVAAVAVPAASGARLRAPDLETWLDGGQALPSPATASHLRPGVQDEDAESLLPHPWRRRG